MDQARTHPAQNRTSPSRARHGPGSPPPPWLSGNSFTTGPHHPIGSGGLRPMVRSLANFGGEGSLDWLAPSARGYHQQQRRGRHGAWPGGRCRPSPADPPEPAAFAPRSRPVRNTSGANVAWRCRGPMGGSRARPPPAFSFPQRSLHLRLVALRHALSARHHPPHAGGRTLRVGAGQSRHHRLPLAVGPGVCADAGRRVAAGGRRAAGGGGDARMAGLAADRRLPPGAAGRRPRGEPHPVSDPRRSLPGPGGGRPGSLDRLPCGDPAGRAPGRRPGGADCPRGGKSRGVHGGSGGAGPARGVRPVPRHRPPPRAGTRDRCGHRPPAD